MMKWFVTKYSAKIWRQKMTNDFFNALKPNKEIDRSWGIGMKVPICPNCEAIISPMCFWENCGDKVGWCEYCGQKIDWSGWEDE